MDDLSKAFDIVMSRVKFNGNAHVAYKWREWQDARPKPKLRDHLVRLWRTLKKGHTK